MVWIFFVVRESLNEVFLSFQVKPVWVILKKCLLAVALYEFRVFCRTTRNDSFKLPFWNVVIVAALSPRKWLNHFYSNVSYIHWVSTSETRSWDIILCFVHENTVESDRRRSLKEQPCDQWSERNVKLNISLLAFWFIMKLVLCLLSYYLNFENYHLKCYCEALWS